MEFTTWFRDHKLDVCDNLGDLVAYHNKPDGALHLKTVVSVNSRPGEFFSSVGKLVAALGLHGVCVKGPAVLLHDDDPDL